MSCCSACAAKPRALSGCGCGPKSLGHAPMMDETFIAPIVRARCQALPTPEEYAACVRAEVKKQFQKNAAMYALIGGGALAILHAKGWLKMFGITALSFGGMMAVGRADLWRAS